MEPSKYLQSDYCTSSSTATTTTSTANTTFNLQHPHKRVRRRRSKRNDYDDDDENDSHDDEPGWNITSEMKARIQQSSWLRKELQDGGLRQLIDTIDAASDAEEEEEEEENDADNDADDTNGKDNGKKSDAQHGRINRNWNQKKRTNPKKYATSNISARELALARTKHTHPKFASFTDQLLLLAGVLQPAASVAGCGGGAEDGGGECIISDGMHLVLAPVPRLNNTTLLKSIPLGTEGKEEEEGEDEDEVDEIGSKNSGSSSTDSEDDSSSSSSEEDSDESNDCAEE